MKRELACMQEYTKKTKVIIVRWEITTNLINMKYLIAKQQLHCRRIVDGNKMHLFSGDRSASGA
jgi:hypothetical protein